MNDITIRRPIKWYSSSDTNVGMVREINEDSIMSNPDIGLWAVADGMGGYEAGNVASNMIVNSLDEIELKPGLSDTVDAIEDQLLDVNHRILEYAEIMLEGRTLGSTIVSMLLRGQVGVCMWVGDSRLYRLRNNELMQISRDHSQVEELLQQGLIREDEVENHPESNVITRAIGTSEELYVDVSVFSAQIGDTYLLCSDGLYNAVEKEDIISQLTNPNTEDAVKQLIVRSLENGATDNVSIIIVKGLTTKDDTN